MLLDPYRFGAPPSAMLTGLVSHWKLDEVSGNAIDSHGTNHLTNIAVSSAAGMVGNARDFEASNITYLYIPSNASLRMGDIEYTICAWAKWESLTGTQTICAKDNDSNSREYGLIQSSNVVSGFICPGGSSASQVIASYSPLSTGIWYFLVYWHDPAANKIYLQVNNGAIAESAVSGGAFVGAAQFMIGAIDSGVRYAFDGLIDEVSIWKRILSPAERSALFNSGNGIGYPFDGSYVPPPPSPPLLVDLVSYWKLDEASGNAIDSHRTNHLTDTNTVTSAAGKIGTARDFELSTTEYFTINSNPTLQLGDIEFTITAWVKFESLGTIEMICSKDGETANREFALYFNNGTSRISAFIAPTGLGASVVGVTADALGAPSIGVWYFIVFWHDPVANKIYLQVNNGGINEATVSGGAFVGTAPFRIGAYSGGPIYAFDGLIDEVGFWKRMLTPSERAELYNSGNGKTYPFI